MHRIDDDGNVNGQFVEGDPESGQPATRVGAKWLNAVQEEICNAIEGAGFVLDEEDDEQLKKVFEKIWEKTDRLEPREEGGLSVLGGLGTPSLEADGGPGATKPAVYGRGRGGTAPGGRFEGSSPLRASADSGASPAVLGERRGSATGPVFAAEDNSGATPERGLFYIGPCAQPTQPVRGDVYRDAISGRVLYYDGSTWIPIALPSSATRRHVVGAAGEPALGSGYTTAPGGGLYMPSFHISPDGRRVWLDGYVQHMANQALEIFTLPEGFRPDHDVVFIGSIAGKADALVIVTTAGVVTADQVNLADIFNVSLAGLSFELASP